jgi:tetratricopeptide (TPR) repeat protein
MAGIGRNAPCPCGSGKRYKECHGALESRAAPAAEAQSTPGGPPWVPQVMRDALRAQRSGKGDEAARLYRRVLEADPANFDATHMLGLVEYECGQYDVALDLVRRAIELRPDLGSPRHNLRLLETMPRVEVEVCREVLPRLAPRLDLTIDVARLGAAGTVNIVVGDTLGEEGRAALSHLVTASGVASVTLWDEGAGDAVVRGVRACKLSVTEHPRGGSLVLFGAARSPVLWLPGARAQQVLLVATRDEPCAIVDRIDELAAAGYDRPGLLCATRALADRLRLPRAATLPRQASAACVDA